MDVLKLAHREPGSPPKLVSAGDGVRIEGPDDGLRRLNALLVPAPTFFEVGSKTYISLAPVLRCRWRGPDSKGPWVVRFSMTDIGGFKYHNFSKHVSVFSRPTSSPGDQWEPLDRVEDVDEGSDDEEETVSVVVPHFSDLIAAVDNATASERSKGYIVKPRKLRLLKVTHCCSTRYLGSVTPCSIFEFRVVFCSNYLTPRRGCSTSNCLSQGVYSKTVLVHNASPVKLKYFQLWPSLIRTGGAVSAEAMGVSVSIGGSCQARDLKETIDEGVFDPWPRVGGGGRLKYESPPPDPEKLSTRVMWQNLCLNVYTGDEPTHDMHLRRFECAAANHVILLDGVERLTVRPRAERDAVAQA